MELEVTFLLISINFQISLDQMAQSMIVKQVILLVVMPKKCIHHSTDASFTLKAYGKSHFGSLCITCCDFETRRSSSGSARVWFVDSKLTTNGNQSALDTKMLSLPNRLQTHVQICLWKLWINLIFIYLCALTKSQWIRPDTHTLRLLYRRILRSHTCTSADSPSRRCRLDRSPRSSVRWSPEDIDTPPWRDRRGLRSHTCTANCSLAPSVCHRRLKGNRKHCYSLIQTLLVYLSKFDFCSCDLLQFYLFVFTRFSFEEEKNTMWKHGSNVNQTLPPIFTLGISSLSPHSSLLFIQFFFSRTAFTPAVKQRPTLTPGMFSLWLPTFSSDCQSASSNLPSILNTEWNLLCWCWKWNKNTEAKYDYSWLLKPAWWFCVPSVFPHAVLPPPYTVVYAYSHIWCH